MTERAIHANLKTSLLNNDPFVFLNLVKFEKPVPASAYGEISGKATDYTYITDAPYNVTWDDGSVDSLGVNNGAQIYIANKLLNVGTIQETTEARATTISIKLSTVALGTITITTPSITATYIDTTVDLAAEGFREGDTVLLETETGNNNGKYIRLDRFTSEGSSDLSNSRVYVTPLNTTLSVNSGQVYTFTLSSPELKALTLSKEAALYSSYINREVFIYRAHLKPSTGEIIGAPFLLFRGIISSGGLQEAPSGESSISWGLTSHWGDFIRVQGRLTSDSTHRALSTSGRADENSIIRPEYATDYGFMHAEQSISVLATYQAQELRYKMKKRGGLAGLLGGKKVVEYYETVDRDVDLRFDLSAKYLPVVYGVQKVSNIPVFADVNKNNPAEFYVAFAICEGEIGGIYDIHVDNQSSVCLDSMDEGVRGETYVANNEDANVSVICYGRADEGFVLSGETYQDTGFVPIEFLDRNYPGYDFRYLIRGGLWGRGPMNRRLGTAYNAPAAQGLTHETSYTFETPIDATFIIHTGKKDQEANELLVDLASSKTFKIQSDYFEGDPSNYWSTSHRLLDTAYVVGKFTLSEGEETIPDYEFVIKGMYINCYNYDCSYKIYSGDPSTYKIGDVVNLSVSGGGSHSSIQIIDKWTLYDSSGNPDVRFRWRTNWPNAGDTLVNIGSGSVITMTASGKPTITMRTYNHKTDASGTATATPTSTLNSVSYTDSGGNGVLTATFSSGAFDTIMSAGGANNVYISPTTDRQQSFVVRSWATPVATLAPFSGAAEALESFIGDTFTVSNVVPASNTAENGNILVISKEISGRLETREKTLSVRTASYMFTASPFYSDFYIEGGETFYTEWQYKDLRVSINPAMQLLDYITSRRYGRGLDINKDIELDTWRESARLCDDNSKVTVVTTTAPNVGDTFYINRGDGSLIFQGTVSTVTARTYSGTKYEVEFDKVIGKLGYKWNNWRTYTAGDLVWYNDVVKTAAGGKIATSTSFTGSSVAVSLARVGGGASLTVVTSYLGGLKNTNPLVRAWSEADLAFSSPGYSLHDSDDVYYWKYLGWDGPEQRYVTRHQMNQIVNTNVPIFDNINSMLEQFNGILRYCNGKYELDVKTAAPISFVEGIDSISEDNIIGDIKLDDQGQKNSYNSISASIVDPQNKFAGRSISFFDSNYLREDKGVPKQGNFALPGITNYYSARTNIVQFLRESRYGLGISFTRDPKGYLLKPGNIIALNYSRFEWLDKLFRINTLNVQRDGLVQILADEHNDAAYLLDYEDRDLSYNPGGGSPGITIVPPTNLQASQDLDGAIQLIWTNSLSYNPQEYQVEIWAAQATKDSSGEYILDSFADPIGNEFVNATLLDIAYGSNYVHNGLGEATNTNENGQHIWYYWIRYAKPPIAFRDKISYSAYEPLKTGPGVEGRAYDAIADNARVVTLTLPKYTWTYDENGNIYTPPDAVTVTANLFNSVGTPYYQFFIYDAQGTLVSTIPGTPSITSTFTYTPPQTIGNDISDPRYMPETIKVEVRENAVDAPIEAIDMVPVQGIQEGSSAIQVVNSNPSHLVLVPPSGIPNLTGSGTTIEVFEGTTVLTPVAGPDLDPGQYKVLVDTATNINAGSITPGVGVMVIGDHTSMTADQANILYDVVIQKASGAEITFNTSQFFTKVSDGTQGRTCTLLASDHSVIYDSEGANPSFNGVGINIVLTAICDGYTDPEYRLIQDGGTPGAWTPGDTLNEASFNYAPPSTYTQGTTVFELEAREGSSGDATSADTISIVFVKEGTGGLSGVLTNENHSVTALADGTGYSLTNAGGLFEVFSGGLDVTSQCEFRVNSVAPVGGISSDTSSGLTLSIDNVTIPGIYTLSGASWTSSSENFTLTAVYSGQTITKIYSISKVLAGVGGRTAMLVADDYTVIYNDAGGGANPAGPISLTLTAYNFTNPEYSFESELANITGGPVYPTFSADNTASFTVPANFSGWTGPCLVYGRVREAGVGVPVILDTIDIYPISNSTSAFTISMTNPSQGLSEIGGIISFDNSGTNIEVFEGADKLGFTTGALSTTAGSVTSKWTILSRTYGGGIIDASFNEPEAVASGTPAIAVIGELDEDDLTPWDNTATYTAYCDYLLSIRRKNQTSGDTQITVRQNWTRNVQGTDGSDSYIVYLTNATHNILTAEDFTSPQASGSGTSISVYKGGVKLVWDVSSPYAVDTWRVSAVAVTEGTGVTPDTSYSVVNDVASYGPHTFASPWNSATAKIQYTVIIQDPAGPITLNYYQTFTRVPTGATGDDGIYSEVTVPAAMIPTDNDGEGYSTNSGGYINNPTTGASYVGIHKVYDGPTDVTDQATHTIVGGSVYYDSVNNDYYGYKTQNGVTCYVAQQYVVAALPEGAYFWVAWDGKGWSSDSEVFTLQAVYGGKTLVKNVSINKVKSGDPAPVPPAAAGLTVAFISRYVSAVGSNASVVAAWKADNDGSEYKDSNTGYRAIAKWLKEGAAGDVQLRFTTLTGTPTLSPTAGTWRALSTDATASITRSVVGITTASVRAEIRDTATSTTLASVVIELEAEKISSGGALP